MSFDLEMLGRTRAFSFKNVGMRVMCHVMSHAGALADDDPPPWPEWPAHVTFDHEEILEEALEDSAKEASLSREDRKLVWSKRTAIEARRRARSTLAEKLRAFAETFDDASVTRIEGARREQRRAAIEEMKRQGRSIAGIASDVDPIELSLDEWKKWILDFAEFNAEAAAGGGYRVR